MAVKYLQMAVVVSQAGTYGGIGIVVCACDILEFHMKEI